MHIINRLYHGEFDYPEMSKAPAKAVMVASLPRSGSTIFCEHMWRTGCLGAPMEYPAIPNRFELYRRLGSENSSDYWRKVQAVRTSPNGVFSYKMFINNLLNISREHPDLYREMQSTHIVYFTRADLLGQAISHSRALRSGIWFAGVNRDVRIDYDEKHIDKCLKNIIEQKLFWEELFRASGSTVHRVLYEDFMLQPDITMNAIADFVGVALEDGCRMDIPLIESQRDETSREWRQRYLASKSVRDLENRYEKLIEA